MADGDPRMQLRGRKSESQALDSLVSNLRIGQSAVLVVRGEAGIGKTALLDYVQANSSGCRIARATGVESEMELAYGALHQLCGQMLQRSSHPHRHALETALGLATGDAPDRFLVGLSTLNLLAEVAEDLPLICLVDDAQWLDRVSAQTLAFVARRLLAERVALVFAVREPSDANDLNGLPEIQVGGLNYSDSRALLDDAITIVIDEPARDRFIAESRGNPLALIELPRVLSTQQFIGGFGPPDDRPMVRRIEEGFLQQLQPLPPATRRFLLTAAADPLGDSALLWRATEALGIDPNAAIEAESADLIEIGVRVRFRHPLARSAVYRAASPGDRRSVHNALADATDPSLDPDRRAWHLAQAAVGPDENVALRLQEAAERARARGGLVAAGAFLEQATALTPDPARRTARALAAAETKLDAGAPDAAHELLSAAEIGPMDDHQRAHLARLRAEIVFNRNRGSDAVPLFLEAANRLEAVGDPSTRQVYLEALGAAIFAGRLNRNVGPREVAAAAREAPPADTSPRPTDLLLDGLAIRYTEGFVAGVAPLRSAVRAFGRGAESDKDEVMRWFWLPWLAAGDLWDDDMWHELTVHGVRLARESGALTVLPLALGYSALVHLHAGEFGMAKALNEEADVIANATGNAPVRYPALYLEAWRGIEPKATLDAFAKGLEEAGARGEGRALGGAAYATAMLHNALGRYEEALACARTAFEYDDLGVHGFSLVEMVEAAARSGAQKDAVAAVQRLEERTTAAGTDWALGVQAQSRALLSSGQAAESLYREAIDRLRNTRISVQLARAHLVYGEWLRRETRRTDARAQLRTAHEMFTEFGAEAFAERTRRELLATGETVQKRTTTGRDVLTVQEAQIARLAASGLTNPEIAGQLFLSRHTVEWHLRKVFSKLGISSRQQLRGTLGGTVIAREPA